MGKQTDLHAAIAIGFCGFAVWTTGDACIRFLRDYPPPQIAFLSSLYVLVFLFCFLPFLGGLRATFQKQKMGLQVLRGLALGASAVATFYTFTHLEMVTAFSIIFLTPLVAKIVSVILNKEHITLTSWLISLTGFAGVLLVLRPGAMPIGVGEIAALCVPATFALGYVLSRTIGEENQTPFSTLLFMDLSVCVLMLMSTLGQFVPMSPTDFTLTLYIAFTGAAGTLLVSRAYAAAPSAYIAPLHYTQIIWGALWGVLFFGEYPDGWTLAGAAVIIGAGLALVWQSRKAS